MPTTDDGVIHDTDRHPRRRRVCDLTPDELHRQCLEALVLLAFGTPAQREAFFGEKVSVNARDQRESVRLLRQWGVTVEYDAPSHTSRCEQEPSWR